MKARKWAGFRAAFDAGKEFFAVKSSIFSWNWSAILKNCEVHFLALDDPRYEKEVRMTYIQ
ncbi:MAG: hypothetical protein GY820_16850 [Gammaproteobacteria bacterium]|nr:hypothetical protein [Gammaproteobacteria bacterium]